MKKKAILALSLSFCCLTGCGAKKSENAALSSVAEPEIIEIASTVEGNDYVTAQGLRYEGDCTAPKQNGVFQGSGSFASTEGWNYVGNFAAGVFAGGRVENYPIRLNFAGLELSGVYSGEVQELLPQGQGSFTEKDGGRYTGSFSSGRPADGQAEGIGACLYFGGSVTGRYTGGVAGGELSGQGIFVSEGGRMLRYEGSFDKSEPSGNGTLSDSGFLCLNEGSPDRGSYEGSTVDGKPSGQGHFRGRNSENIDYSYSGTWSGGLFEGEGTLCYESELYYNRTGHFTAGVFTPTGMELLECLGTAEPRFTLSEKTREYIAKFPELLSHETALKKTEDCDYRGEYNPLLTFNNFMAEPEKFEGRFMYVFNDKILYRRTITSFGENNPVGLYVGANALYAEPVVCFFLGSFGSFESANVFNCYAIPLGKTSYTNADGDTIDAIALLVGAVTTY